MPATERQVRMSCRKAARSWIASVAALVLTACGGGGGDSSNDTNNGDAGSGDNSGNNTSLVAGSLSIALPSQPVSEAAATATITFTLNGSTTTTISGSVMANGGTATNGVDYTLVGPTTFSFSPTDTAAKTVTLSIVNDTVDEPNESVILTFNFGDGNNTNIVTVSVSIADDDAGPAGSPVALATAARVSAEQGKLPSLVSTARTAGTVSPSIDVAGTSILALNYLKASDTDADAMLGSAVAVASFNGKITAAIGAPAEHGNVGAVYVYTTPASGDAPPSGIRIEPPIVQAMRFGYAVQLSRDGNTLVVGAPDESNNQSGIGSYPDTPNGDAAKSGAVFIYSRTNGAWSETPVYVKAIDVAAQDAFGSALALSAGGDVLVVGAPGQDSPATQSDDVVNGTVDSGAAYVSVLKQGTWSMLNGILKAAHVGSGDKFGSAVAIAPRGLTIAVGAPYEDGITLGGDLKPDSGAAYLFTLSNPKGGTDLLVEQTLRFKAANSSAEDLFGKSVALGMEGKVLTVGARFGTAVALSVDGNTLLVGAPAEEVN